MARRPDYKDRCLLITVLGCSSRQGEHSGVMVREGMPKLHQSPRDVGGSSGALDLSKKQGSVACTTEIDNETGIRMLCMSTTWGGNQIPIAITHRLPPVAVMFQ